MFRSNMHIFTHYLFPLKPLATFHFSASLLLLLTQQVDRNGVGFVESHFTGVQGFIVSISRPTPLLGGSTHIQSNSASSLFISLCARFLTPSKIQLSSPVFEEKQGKDNLTSLFVSRENLGKRESIDGVSRFLLFLFLMNCFLGEKFRSNSITRVTGIQLTILESFIYTFLFTWFSRAPLEGGKFSVSGNYVL